MRHLALAAALAVCALSADAQAPSTARCFDARDVQGMVQSDAHTLAVKVGGDAHFRIDLAAGCPDVGARGDAQLLSPGGLVCGHPREFVTGNGQACPIAFVFPEDAASFAQRARGAAGAAGGEGMLGRVTVMARRTRGFEGTVEDCMDARWMRGWSEDGEGVVVDVSPRRSGGVRRYRVAFVGGCDRLESAHGLQFNSRVGGSLICGRPGDVALFSGDPDRAPSALAAFDRVGTRGCAVAEVQALHDASTGGARRD